MDVAAGSRARDARRDQVRRRIEDALFEAVAAGDVEGLSHDRLAERADVSRRTVYRYFPSRAALTRARSARVVEAVTSHAAPRTEAAMLAGLDELFRDFDANATATMVALASGEGRTARNATAPERVRLYRAALADATRGLSGPDRTQAIAAIQLLGSGLAWREMRDQWHLPANQIAAACRWAIEVLLADLRGRGNRPLSDGPARQGTL